MRYFMLLKRLKTIIILFVSCFTVSLWGQGSFSCDFYDLASGAHVFQEDADQQRIPASTSKLWTVTWAMEYLNVDAKWSTPIEIYGVIKDSVLHGYLNVDFNYDPSWGSEAFGGKTVFWRQFHLLLRQQGIKQVKGEVRLKSKPFDYPPFAWPYADMANYYAAYPYPFVYAENISYLYWDIKPDGVRIDRVEPAFETDYYTSKVEAGDVRGDMTYILGSPFAPEKTVVGQLPKSRTEYTTKGVVHDPLQYFSWDMTQEGLLMPAKVIDSTFIKRFEYAYCTYEEVIAEALQHSNNLFTECLHQVVKQNHKGVLNDFVEKISPDKKAYMHDACGLSPQNHFSAQDHVALLAYAYPKHEELLKKLLPIAGQSGTMKYFGRNTEFSGKVWAKSGSMGGVKAYIGYCEKNGKWYAFALLLNHFEGTSNFSSRKYLEQKMGAYYQKL